MTTPTVLAGALALALVPATAIAAPKPPKPPTNPKPPAGTVLTLDAAPNPVVFTKPVALTGKLGGGNASAVRLRLEQDTTRPYGDAYQATGLTATTQNNGNYGFSVKPQKNTQYRVVSEGATPMTSNPRLVNVRPLVGLRVSTQRPLVGGSVRFSGIVLPARNGSNVSIQKNVGGRFVTVRRAVLRASAPGSSYSTRLRIRSSGTYRVKLPGTSTFVNGFSRSLAITVR